MQWFIDLIKDWVIAQKYATQNWVIAQAYATKQYVDDLIVFVLKWVTDQNYATEDWVLRKGYATVFWVIEQINATVDWVSTYNPKAQAYLSAPQSIPSMTPTKINFDVIAYDTHSLFANARFTTDRAGYFLCSLSAGLINPSAGSTLFAFLYKNGTQRASYVSHASSAFTHSSSVVDILHLEAGDYIEGFCSHNVGADRNLSPGINYTFVSISRLF